MSDSANLMRAKALLALRSRRYRQIYGFLCGGPRAMCASGVLCDVSGVGRWVGNYYVVGRRRASKFAPPEVLAVFGLTREDDKEITKRNDGYRRPSSTLREIADFLEAKWART